jgi:hypothetical protein
MAGLTIRGRDPLGVELTIRVGGDGSIVADTPDSAFPPNNLVVGVLPDQLVPDTAGDSECRLRGKRPTREQLVEECALAIHGWLLMEWATFGVAPLQGCLGRLFRGGEPRPAANAPLKPAQAGGLDPEFGPKLIGRVLGHLEHWHAGSR